MKLKIYLIVLLVISLVKITADAKSENELLLALSFSFLCWCYIYNECFDSYLQYKRKEKIRTDIELIIKNYDESTFDKFLHPYKNREKEVRMVRTRPDDVD